MYTKYSSCCFFVYPDRGQGQLFVQPITVRHSVEETCLETRSRSSIITFILHHGLNLTADGINLELSIMCQKLAKSLQRKRKNTRRVLGKDCFCNFCNVKMLGSRLKHRNGTETCLETLARFPSKAANLTSAQN